MYKLHNKVIKVFVLLGFILLIASCEEKQKKESEKNSLGEIDFPNSGSEKAQKAFYRGVLALHNFWYPVAEESFREARKIDPEFALAYWGEAMSNNKTFWQVQNADRAREILDSLGSSSDERIPKAKLEVEKDFLRSLDILFSDNPEKIERDMAYMTFMEKMVEKYPENNEVRAFYALSLLGVLRNNQGNEDVRMKAAAEAQRILDNNPKHPGALHYKIHSLDDPLHAVLALDAAYEYARVAPESNHALHMPSHIFVQLGMWDNVCKSNIDARNASEKWVSEEGLPLTYLDNHSLAWLAYGYTQRGLFDSALAKLRIIQKNNADTFERGDKHYELDILSRIWIENTGDLENYRLDISETSILGIIDKVMYQFLMAWSEIEKGDNEKAGESIDQIKDYMDSIEDENVFRKALAGIYYNSIMGLQSYQTSGFENASEYFDKAVQLEESLNPPTGPPDMVKPVHELYGEICLKEGKLDKAIELFQMSLERTPNRSMSRLGLARAYRLKGDFPSAKYQYEKFAENYRDASDDPNQSEALTFIKNNQDINSNAALSSNSVQLKYDEAMKITQCLPLN